MVTIIVSLGGWHALILNVRSCFNYSFQGQLIGLKVNSGIHPFFTRRLLRPATKRIFYWPVKTLGNYQSLTCVCKPSETHSKFFDWVVETSENFFWLGSWYPQTLKGFFFKGDWFLRRLNVFLLGCSKPSETKSSCIDQMVLNVNCTYIICLAKMYSTVRHGLVELICFWLS